MGLPEAMSPDLEKLLDGSGWVKSLARSLVADPHTADDLVQEAWVVALERGPEGADRPGLKRWIAAVLRNLARDRRRGEGRRAAREHDAARGDQHGDDAGALLDRLDTHRRIVDAVRGLDEPYRTAILLRYFEGASPAEIARRLAVPVRTVHSRLHRALSKLRSTLRGDFGGDRGTWLLALLPLSRKGGWTTGALSGALIMDAKLKLAFAGAALVGVAAMTTLTGDDLAPSDAVVAAVPTGAEATLETPRLDEPAERPAAGERAPAAAPVVAQPTTALPESPPEPAETHEVRGRVLDVDGMPLSGVQVGFGPRTRSDRRSSSEQRTQTARDGRFTFESEAIGSHLDDREGEIVLLDERYTTVLQPTTGFRAGSDTEFVLVVAAQQPLGGIVVDLAGTPVSGAKVTIDVPHDFHARFTVPLEHSRTVHWSATTDENGRFDLPQAPRLEDANLVTAAAGFAYDVQRLPAEPTAELEIVLGAREENVTLLEGSVIDQQGRPVEGAFVALEFSNGITDAAGNFSMRIHGAGERGVLMALKRGMLPGRIERSGPSNIEPGAWPEPLVLTLGGEPLAIRGRVVDPDGEPLSGLKVWSADTTHFGAVARADFGPMMTVAADVETLLRDPDDDRKTETDADGFFTLDGLLDRDYRISLHDVDTATFHRTEPVRAGRDGLTISMPREELNSRVAGRLLGRDGEPIVAASIALCQLLEAQRGYADDVASASTHTDAEGRFEFHDMPVSLDHVRVQGAGLDLMGNRLPIPEGADLEQLEFVVTRRCRLRVELGDPDEADGFRLLDADGQESWLTIFRGNAAWTTASGDLAEGRSEAVSASELATTLVLTRGHEDVRQVAIQLVHDELNVLRL